MARRVIRADEVKIGDVMAPSLEAGTFSVKEVYKTKHPTLNSYEVTIKGPIGIVRKMHASKLVTVLK